MQYFDTLKTLAMIDPAPLTYSEWIKVGMALKAEGATVEDWDAWSSQDSARYTEGECKHRWDTFDGSGVGGGTLVEIARRYGGMPVAKHSCQDDQILDMESLDLTGVTVQEMSDKHLDLSAKEQIKLFLTTLFKVDDIITLSTTTTYASGDKWHPGKATPARVGDLLKDLDKYDGIEWTIGDYHHEAGAYVSFNTFDGKGGDRSNVTSYRYALIECDEISLKDQEKAYRELNLPIATLVYSGGKSLHAVCRVDAKDKDEYGERVAFLYKICIEHDLKIDLQNKNPNRYTRLPGVVRGDKEQKLVATNIGAQSWNAWLDWLEEDGTEKIEHIPLKKCSDVEPREVNWLVSGIIPRGGLVVLAGDGGAGKSTIICDLIASVTTGAQSILTRHEIPYDNGDGEDVVAFLGEDDMASVGIKRLEQAHADLTRVMHLEPGDKNFQKIKLGSKELDGIISEYKPALLVLDPIELYIPEGISMTERAPMYEAMVHTRGIASKVGTTVLCVAHTNKTQTGGRNRIADTAGLWDAARSVLMVGLVPRPKSSDDDRAINSVRVPEQIRYVSHEKNNCGRTKPTVLFTIEEDGLRFQGTRVIEKDTDFVALANSKKQNLKKSG